MRLLTLLVGMIGVVGAASAGDTEFNNINRYDSSDYAAKLFYNVQFGGHQAVQPQSSLSFQVNNERASQFGAPVMFRTDFGSSGITRFALNGVDLKSKLLAVKANEAGILGATSTVELVGLAVIGLVSVFYLVEVVDTATEDNPTFAGTGGS